MPGGQYIALSGMRTRLDQLDRLASDLANVGTTGYKTEKWSHLEAARPAFDDALQSAIDVTTGSRRLDVTAGAMNPTGRDLDVAIEGAGWIAVQLPDGSEGYTRNGSLQVNVNGVLQTRNGMSVLGDGGPIAVPNDVRVSVGSDGTVSTVPNGNAATQVQNIGRIKLVNPPEQQLVRGDDGMFRLQGGAQADVDPKVKVHGAALEGSNVNPVEAMVSMISLARQFDMQMKMLQNADGNDRQATQLLSMSR